mmetsp:Transcript_21491/g.48688  ORF Transcript_21491/g.48688 Transcript_21491/m.48688 type:complete len:210 (-) Transcript_21491:40-669(-)
MYFLVFSSVTSMLNGSLCMNRRGRIHTFRLVPGSSQFCPTCHLRYIADTVIFRGKIKSIGIMCLQPSPSHSKNSCPSSSLSTRCISLCPSSMLVMLSSPLLKCSSDPPPPPEPSSSIRTWSTSRSAATSRSRVTNDVSNDSVMPSSLCPLAVLALILVFSPISVNFVRICVNVFITCVLFSSILSSILSIFLLMPFTTSCSCPTVCCTF